MHTPPSLFSTSPSLFPRGGRRKAARSQPYGRRRGKERSKDNTIDHCSRALGGLRRPEKKRDSHVNEAGAGFLFPLQKKRKVTARAFPRCFNGRRRQTKKLNPEREDLFPFSKFPPFQLPLLSALIESAMRGGSFIDEKISPSPPSDKPPACGGRRGASVRCALEEGIGGGRGIEGEKSRMMCYANYTLSLLSRRMEEGRRAGGGGGGREQRCTTHTQASKEHSLLIQGPPLLSSPSLPLCQVD